MKIEIKFIKHPDIGYDNFTYLTQKDKRYNYGGVIVNQHQYVVFMVKDKENSDKTISKEFLHPNGPTPKDYRIFTKFVSAHRKFVT